MFLTLKFLKYCLLKNFSISLINPYAATQILKIFGVIIGI